MTSTVREPKLAVLAGCLKGLASLMCNFTKSMEEGIAWWHLSFFLYGRTTSLKWIPVWFLNFVPVVDSHAVVRGNAEIHVCPSPGTSRWRLSWRSAAWWTFGSCLVPVASHAPTWVLNLVLCRFIACGLVCAHDSRGPGSLPWEQPLSCPSVATSPSPPLVSPPLLSSHSHCSVSHLELCPFTFV